MCLKRSCSYGLYSTMHKTLHARDKQSPNCHCASHQWDWVTIRPGPILCHVINRIACVELDSIPTYRKDVELNQSVPEQELLIDSELVRNASHAIPDLQSSFREHKISRKSRKH